MGRKRDSDVKVETLLEKRENVETGFTEYLVRWKGFNEDWDTWEPAGNLGNCKKIMKEFERARKNSADAVKKHVQKLVKKSKLGKDTVKKATQSLKNKHGQTMIVKLPLAESKSENQKQNISAMKGSSEKSSSSESLGKPAAMKKVKVVKPRPKVDGVKKSVKKKEQTESFEVKGQSPQAVSSLKPTRKNSPKVGKAGGTSPSVEKDTSPKIQKLASPQTSSPGKKSPQGKTSPKSDSGKLFGKLSPKSEGGKSGKISPKSDGVKVVKVSPKLEEGKSGRSQGRSPKKSLTEEGKLSSMLLTVNKSEMMPLLHNLLTQSGSPMKINSKNEKAAGISVKKTPKKSASFKVNSQKKLGKQIKKSPKSFKSKDIESCKTSLEESKNVQQTPKKKLQNIVKSEKVFKIMSPSAVKKSKSGMVKKRELKVSVGHLIGSGGKMKMSELKLKDGSILKFLKKQDSDLKKKNKSETVKSNTSSEDAETNSPMKSKTLKVKKKQVVGVGEMIESEKVPKKKAVKKVMTCKVGKDGESPVVQKKKIVKKKSVDSNGVKGDENQKVKKKIKKKSADGEAVIDGENQVVQKEKNVKMKKKQMGNEISKGSKNQTVQLEDGTVLLVKKAVKKKKMEEKGSDKESSTVAESSAVKKAGKKRKIEDQEVVILSDEESSDEDDVSLYSLIESNKSLESTGEKNVKNKEQIISDKLTRSNSDSNLSTKVLSKQKSKVVGKKSQSLSSTICGGSVGENTSDGEGVVSPSKKMRLLDSMKTSKVKPVLRPVSPTPLFTSVKPLTATYVQPTPVQQHATVLQSCVSGDVSAFQYIPAAVFPISPSSMSYQVFLENIPQQFQQKKGKKTGSRSGEEEDKEVERRLSVRQSECAFRYKEIVIKKCQKYTQIWLNTHTTMKNALNPQVIQEMISALTAAKYDDSNLVMLGGLGNVFCSGIDLHFLVTGDKRVAARQMVDALRDFTKHIITFPKPIVAVVTGPAIGLGMTMLPLCDVVYASDKATFFLPYAQLSQTPEGCASFTLPQAMGMAMASDLLIGGRKLTAIEACQLGLISQVFWPTSMMQEVMPRVQNMALQSGKALETTKLLIRSHQRTKLDLTNESESNLLLERWPSAECQKAIEVYLSNEKNYSL